MKKLFILIAILFSVNLVFSQESKDQVNYLWIVDESDQTFLNYSKVLRVKPVENCAEVSIGMGSCKDASKDVEGFDDIFSLHLTFITVKDSTEHCVELTYVFLKDQGVVIIEPKTHENFEKLPELFLLIWPLKYSQIKRVLCYQRFHQLRIGKQLTAC